MNDFCIFPPFFRRKLKDLSYPRSSLDWKPYRIQEVPSIEKLIVSQKFPQLKNLSYPRSSFNWKTYRIPEVPSMKDLSYPRSSLDWKTYRIQEVPSIKRLIKTLILKYDKNMVTKYHQKYHILQLLILCSYKLR